MKTLTLLLLTCCLALSSSCKDAEQVINSDPDPVANAAPSFNQVNTAFRSSHVNCLLNQWYGKTYKNEPIVFRVINDETAYNAFFACTPITPLPAIDFSKNSLLVGMKADYYEFINTPTSITNISQTLVASGNDNYVLQVKVTGSQGRGGEWFAFTSLVPKITGKVNLDMQYQFK